MSAETMEWLNNYVLVGFTDKRGEAWHYRQDLQGDEPNHYAGAIPIDDVLRRLFNWEVIEKPLQYYFEVDGKKKLCETDRKLMIASDNGDLLGVFKDGYQGHSYKEWLLDNVSNILDDNLAIGSAGLLRNRGQAWVTVEVPENVTTPEGVEFRPNLLACTSFDGTLATTYKRVVTVVVCDNTLAASLGESGQVFKVKHSKYSNARIADAREALAIVHSISDDFAAQVKSLTSMKVSEKVFDKLLDAIIPVPDDEGRGKTVAEKKRDEIIKLYRDDERAAAFNGTAYGVLQAFDTWQEHFAQVRKGTPRIIRNMENVVKDKYSDNNAAILNTLMTLAK